MLAGLLGSSDLRPCPVRTAPGFGIAHPRIGEQDAVAQRVGAVQRDQRAAAVLVRIGDRPVADDRVHQAAAAAEEVLACSERQIVGAEEIEHVRQVERQVRFRLGQVVHVLRIHLVLREDLAIGQQRRATSTAHRSW